MKKILFAAVFFLITHLSVSGQLTIQPGIPATGLIQKNQLWNVLVVNSTNTNYKCVLQLVLTDRLTGAEVLTASTGQFDIAAGAKQLNANVLTPVQYNYLQGGIDNRLQGLIPAGTYTACYELVGVGINKTESLASECVQFDAEPLSPPMLIFPADSAVLETMPAQFSWMPPTPEGMFTRLRYELVIAEVKEGQRGDEAIQQNIPFYNDGTLFTNRMSYPASAAVFEKEKWYAWQVVARDDKAYGGKSEVWIFKISNEAKKATPVSDVYLLLQNRNSGTYQINTRTLHIKYVSNTGTYDGQIVFTDERGNVIKRMKQRITQGDNFFDFTLNNQFRSNAVYSITVVDNNNKHHALTFSINTK